jgi:hypothetical protein
MSKSSNSDAPGDILKLGSGDGRPWVRTPEWILVCGLSAPAQALYTAILGHVNHKKGRTSWPGMDRLAAMLGFKHRHSIARYVRELSAMGAIDVERKPNSTDRRNIYTIHRDPPATYTGPRRIADFETPKVDPPAAAPMATENPAPRDTERSLGRATERSQNQTNTTRRSSTTASGAAPKLPAARRDFASGAAPTGSAARADRHSEERRQELPAERHWLTYDNEILALDILDHVLEVNGGAEPPGVAAIIHSMVGAERPPMLILNTALKVAREGISA